MSHSTYGSPLSRSQSYSSRLRGPRPPPRRSATVGDSSDSPEGADERTALYSIASDPFVRSYASKPKTVTTRQKSSSSAKQAELSYGLGRSDSEDSLLDHSGDDWDEVDQVTQTGQQRRRKTWIWWIVAAVLASCVAAVCVALGVAAVNKNSTTVLVASSSDASTTLEVSSTTDAEVQTAEEVSTMAMGSSFETDSLLPAPTSTTSTLESASGVSSTVASLAPEASRSMPVTSGSDAEAVTPTTDKDETTAARATRTTTAAKETSTGSTKGETAHDDNDNSDEDDDPGTTKAEHTTAKTTTTAHTTAKATATKSASSPTSTSGVSSGGEITYYYQTGEVNCEAYNGEGKVKDTDMICAVSEFDYYESSLCGDKIEICYSGTCIEVTIVDSCEACDKSHFDLSPTAFKTLAGSLDVGEVTSGVTYKLPS